MTDDDRLNALVRAQVCEGVVAEFTATLDRMAEIMQLQTDKMTTLDEDFEHLAAFARRKANGAEAAYQLVLVLVGMVLGFVGGQWAG